MLALEMSSDSFLVEMRDKFWTKKKTRRLEISCTDITLP